MQQAGMKVERKRVETEVETLTAMCGRGESIAEVAHDARNMVSALDLYCDLLDQPGVLESTFAHYAGELRLVAAASRNLVEKLVTLEGARLPSFWRSGDWKDINRSIDESGAVRRNANRKGRERSLMPAAIHSLAQSRVSASFWEPLPSQPLDSLAAELHATRNLLAALAGPSIAVAVDIQGGAVPVRITAEDLTRTLVNLVKNAVEAMPEGGELRISLREQTQGGSRRVTLAVEDSGPGIPSGALELIFAAGYTASSVPAAQISSMFSGSTSGQMRTRAAMTPHRGLGLSITRSIVETAGGRVFAENRAQGGARIVMELPAGKEQVSGVRSQESTKPALIPDP